MLLLLQVGGGDGIVYKKKEEEVTQIILQRCQLFSEKLSSFPVCLFLFYAEKVGIVGKQRDWLK